MLYRKNYKKSQSYNQKSNTRVVIVSKTRGKFLLYHTVQLVIV